MKISNFISTHFSQEKSLMECLVATAIVAIMGVLTDIALILMGGVQF